MLALMVIYFAFGILGYRFFPANGVVQSIVILTLVVFLTVTGIRNNNQYSKLNILAFLVTPLISIVFVFVRIIIVDGGETTGQMISFLIAVLVMLCGLIAFFCCVRSKMMKIIFGCLYIVGYVVALFFLLLLFFIVVVLGGSIVEVKSEVSPNSVYMAVAINNGNVEPGAASSVLIYKPSQDRNLGIGALRRNPISILRTFIDVTLRWESDEILYINEIKHEIRYGNPRAAAIENARAMADDWSGR